MKRLILALGLLLISVSQVQADTPTPREGNVTWIDDHSVSHVVIAQFRDRVPPGLAAAKEGNRSRLARFETDDPHVLIEQLKRRPDVEEAVLSPKAKLFAGPNDPAYSPFQWHLDNPTWEGVNFQDVWELPARPKGSGARVAVIDTGVAWDNPNATDRPQLFSVVAGSDIFNSDDNPTDDHGHGTHVAGTIAQATDNAHGVAGVASGATIVPIKVLDNTGSGTEVEVVEGIYLAANAHAPCVSDGPRNADIINMSLGFPAGTTPAELPGMETAIECAVSRGITVFAASGNDGSFNVSYPAAFPAVIAVGATGIDDFATWFSNGGSALDVTAPGGENCSGFIGFICQFGPSGSSNPDKNSDGVWDGVLQQTFNFGSDPNDPANWGFYLAEGTSMASPHAAGVAALLYGLNPTITPAQVRNILQTTAEDRGDPGRDDTYGFGIVDALAAVNALGPVPTPTPCPSCTPTPTVTPVPPTATPTQTPVPTATPVIGPCSGLISYWKFDETSGTAVADSVGSNNGAAVNGAAISPGKIGNARNFTGSSSQYVNIPGGVLNGLNTGSIAMWVRWSGTQDRGYHNWGHVLGRQKGGAFTNDLIALNGADPATAKVVWAPFSWREDITGTTSVGDGVWRHVVVTFQPGSHRLYIDGVQDGTSASNDIMANDTTVPLSIGAWIADGDGYSTSLIDEVGIWNRALTSTDIANLYNGGNGMSCPSGGPNPTPTPIPTATPTATPSPTPTPTAPPLAQCAAPQIGSTSDSGLSVSFSWSPVSGVSQYAVQRRSVDGWETRADIVGTTFSGDDLASDPDWRVYATFGSCLTPGLATVFDP